MLRVFKIRNANGVELDLTTVGEIVLYDVDGLGYGTDPVMQRIGNHFAVLSDNLQQGEINGEARFWQPGAYKSYLDFAQFCQVKPITLVYHHDAGEFFRDGIMRSVSKAETGGSALTSQIVFLATTPFYKTIYQYNEGSGTTGKKYIYRYPYRYGTSASQSIVIDCDTNLESPVRIEIYGPAVNPVWRHYLNNVLRATGGVNATIEAGRKLIIDTTTIPYQIIQTDLSNKFVGDLYQQSVFSTERFIMLGRGQNVISVAQSGAGVVKLAVEARIEYAAV